MSRSLPWLCWHHSPAALPSPSQRKQPNRNWSTLPSTPSQLVQASAQPVSMEPACPLSQEDLQQIKELLPTLSGVLLPGQEMPVSIGGCPTLQLTFANGSQTRLYLDVSDEIDLAVDQEGPLPAPCYAVEEEQLAPLRDIILSYSSQS